MEETHQEPITLVVHDVVVTPSVAFVAQPIQLELNLDIKETTDGPES